MNRSSSSLGFSRSSRTHRGALVVALALAWGCGDFGEAGASISTEDGSAINRDAIGSGRLTAGAWDDNRNYALFTEYVAGHGSMNGRPPFTTEERDAANAVHSEAPSSNTRLDVALVIDTTGSMGDEIAFLQSELAAIAETIDERYPNAEQRWALVVYRDRGDEYVTRSYDFVTDVMETRRVLDRQSADGGGDYPEAPDAALAAMNELSWRSDDDVARIAFWIADAPHHTERARAMADAIRGAVQRDVHVYPIAASGTDALAELAMRSAAQLTGGRYLFLTDDSGIGDAHMEPTIPCYFVTRLDRAMLRMVDIELTGTYREPTADEVIRTGGDPRDGQCTLAEGKVAMVF